MQRPPYSQNPNPNMNTGVNMGIGGGPAVGMGFGMNPYYPQHLQQQQPQPQQNPALHPQQTINPMSLSYNANPSAPNPAAPRGPSTTSNPNAPATSNHPSQMFKHPMDQSMIANYQRLQYQQQQQQHAQQQQQQGHMSQHQGFNPAAFQLNHPAQGQAHSSNSSSPRATAPPSASNRPLTSQGGPPTQQSSSQPQFINPAQLLSGGGGANISGPTSGPMAGNNNLSQPSVHGPPPSHSQPSSQALAQQQQQQAVLQAHAKAMAAQQAMQMQSQVGGGTGANSGQGQNQNSQTNSNVGGMSLGLGMNLGTMGGMSNLAGMSGMPMMSGMTMSGMGVNPIGLNMGLGMQGMGANSMQFLQQQHQNQNPSGQPSNPNTSTTAPSSIPGPNRNASSTPNSNMKQESGSGSQPSSSQQQPQQRPSSVASHHSRHSSIGFDHAAGPGAGGARPGSSHSMAHPSHGHVSHPGLTGHGAHPHSGQVLPVGTTAAQMSIMNSMNNNANGMMHHPQAQGYGQQGQMHTQSQQSQQQQLSQLPQQQQQRMMPPPPPRPPTRAQTQPVPGAQHPHQQHPYSLQHPSSHSLPHSVSHLQSLQHSNMHGHPGAPSNAGQGQQSLQHPQLQHGQNHPSVMPNVGPGGPPQPTQAQMQMQMHLSQMSQLQQMQQQQQQQQMMNAGVGRPATAPVGPGNMSGMNGYPGYPYQQTGAMHNQQAQAQEHGRTSVPPGDGHPHPQAPMQSQQSHSQMQASHAQQQQHNNNAMAQHQPLQPSQMQPQSMAPQQTHGQHHSLQQSQAPRAASTPRRSMSPSKRMSVGLSESGDGTPAPHLNSAGPTPVGGVPGPHGPGLMSQNGLHMQQLAEQQRRTLMGIGAGGVGAGMGMGMMGMSKMNPSPNPSQPSPSPNPSASQNVGQNVGMSMNGVTGSNPMPNVQQQQSHPPHHSPAQPNGLGMGLGMGLGIGMKLGNANLGPQAQHTPPQPIAQAPPKNAAQQVSPQGPSSVTNNRMSAGPSAVSAVAGGSAANSVNTLLPNVPQGAYDPSRTRVVPVPLSSSTSLIPPLSPRSIEGLKGIIKRDKEYAVVWRGMDERIRAEMTDLGGEKYWWERDGPLPPTASRAGKFGILWPGEKRRIKERWKKKMGRREGVRLPRKVTEAEANVPELLVPIRIELDVDQHKFKETFVWNLNDPVITPDHCAQSIVDDFKLPPQYLSILSKSIAEQLSDFRSHMSDELPTSFVKIEGAIVDEDVFWEGWRKRLRTENGYVKIGRDRVDVRTRKNVDKRTPLGDFELGVVGGEMRMKANEMELSTENAVDKEFRVLLKLDIVVGTMKLDDQFEWDVGEESNSPELFAEVYANELGLSGEFKTAIAHSIREQLHAYQKSLFLVGYPSDVTSIPDADLKDYFLPTVTSAAVARNAEMAATHTPFLNPVDEIELAIGTEKEKNRKRKVRQTTRRRPNALPDRDAIRTHRTPAIGFPDIDPSLFNSTLNSNAGPTTSRRAAAAAASLTIANMVASENGGVVLPSPDRPPVMSAPHVNQRQTKAKGLFKAPPYPPSVLKPRALITGAIESTALERDSTEALVDPTGQPDEEASGTPLMSLTGERRVTAKVPSAKRLKELEREEKEKEYAKRQHPNFIDGVWHCSNCGCPDNIAIGRRKGPLGEKSQCGECGKYYHRYRKPREVVYNTDPEYHLALRDGGSKKKGAAAALRNAGATATPADDLSPAPGDSPAPQAEPEEITPKVARKARQSSSRGSSSEPLLAQQVKVERQATPTDIVAGPPQLESTPVAATSAPLSSTSVPHDLPDEAPPQPQWLIEAWEALRIKCHVDRFEPTLRRSSEGVLEWWIRCLDCPGKNYKTGPEETLNNFEIHLKNRSHRKRVMDRLHPPPPSPPEEF